MIKNIDIHNFGSFKNFIWRDHFHNNGNTIEFKRLNILYGRNYSGKTTFSRILRSYQEQVFPEKYDNPKFDITTQDAALDQRNIASHDLDIRVYNKDFVKENLSFLENHNEGEIRTFAIIGGDNNDIEKLIAQKEKELGDVESDTGLRAKHARKNKEFTAKNTETTQLKNSLNDKLRRHANDVIKQNRDYGNPGYNISAINNDIKRIRNESISILSDKQVTERKNLLKEEELSDIDLKLSFSPQVKDFHSNTHEILSRNIAPTKPIQELLNDAVLQSWAKSGMLLHRDKRDTCGFCRQPLPDKLWYELDEHFSKESSELDTNIKDLIDNIEEEIAALKLVMKVKREDFYSTEKSLFDESKKEFESAVKLYNSQLSSLIKALRERQVNIFKKGTCPDLIEDGSALTSKIVIINDVIDRNNKKTTSLTSDKDKVRIELRIDDVSRFIRDIDLSAEEKKNEGLVVDAKSLEAEVEVFHKQINDLILEIESLRIKQNDEKKGAEKVNDYLNHFFGHEGLKLEAIEDSDTSKFKFNIMRGDEPAYNLSEGECSLVSFCYFIAKLEDVDTKGKEINNLY